MEKYNLDNMDIKYISFDLFDTLIVRMVNKPSEIFDIIEKKFYSLYKKKINFKKNRIRFEKLARKKSSNEEITLEEIYSYFEKIIEKKYCKILMEIEKEVEIAFCERNQNAEVQYIYNYALKHNIPIVVTSDMYLDLDTINAIITKCGYDNISKIYLSSKLKKTKSNLTLFKHVLSDLDIDATNLVHVGDNYISDFINPKKIGIIGINIVNNYSYKFVDSSFMKKNIDYNVICSTIIKTCCDIKFRDYYYEFGYKCFGPLLLGFSNWLINNLHNSNMKDIYFLARDGHILKEAFDILNLKKEFQTHYLYGSRRALIVPSLHKYSTINDMTGHINLPTKILVTDLFKRLGLEKENYESLCLNNGIDLNQYYNLNYILNSKEFECVLSELLDKIKENSTEEYNAMISYFKKMKFENKVAIVDIGWNGNMQYAINEVIENATTFGYYVGLNPNNKNFDKINLDGFICTKNYNEKEYEKLKSFMALFESFFLAQHGSVKKYLLNSNDDVELYEYEYSDINDINVIKLIQNGAMDYLNRIKNYDSFRYISNDSQIYSFNIFNVALNPNIDDAKNLGEILFYEDGIQYIAKVENGFKDYKKSLWKIGFMKNFLKFNFPYYKFYSILKKISK